MEKQISIIERISKCKDYQSLCKFTCSDDFKFFTSKFHHFYFRAFKDFVKSVHYFLYENGLISEAIQLIPFFEVSTLRTSVKLYLLEDTPDGFRHNLICVIPIDGTFNFFTILNRVLLCLKKTCYLNELPF